jgi:hypothetical protein
VCNAPQADEFVKRPETGEKYGSVGAVRSIGSDIGMFRSQHEPA